MHLSELYGLDIYSEGAKYIGKVNDIIINLETGQIVRLTTEPLRSVSKEKAKGVLRDKSVLYRNVSAVGDIVILGTGRGPSSGSMDDDEMPSAPKKSTSIYQRRRSLLGRRH